jgi:hypothetical protein
MADIELPNLRVARKKETNILKYFGKYGLTETSHSRSSQRGILEFFDDSKFYFIHSFIQATDLNILITFNFYFRIPGVLRFKKKNIYIYRDHLKLLIARMVVKPTNTTCQSRKFSRPGNLAPRICAPVVHPV